MQYPIFFVKIIPVLFLWATISGCENSRRSTKDPGFFPISSFFSQETNRLQRRGGLVYKTFKHGTVSQQRRMSVARWADELSLFYKASFDRPAWRDYYVADTLPMAAGYSRVTYRVQQHPELPVRCVQVWFNQAGKAVQVAAHVATHNMLYHTTERWVYTPSTGYSVQKTLTMPFFGTNHYWVQVHWKL